MLVLQDGKGRPVVKLRGIDRVNDTVGRQIETVIVYFPRKGYLKLEVMNIG